MTQIDLSHEQFRILMTDLSSKFFCETDSCLILNKTTNVVYSTQAQQFENQSKTLEN